MKILLLPVTKVTVHRGKCMPLEADCMSSQLAVPGGIVINPTARHQKIRVKSVGARSGPRKVKRDFPAETVREEPSEGAALGAASVVLPSEPRLGGVFIAMIERESKRQATRLVVSECVSAAEPWGVAEFMCGVASLSTAYSRLGITVGGLCEKQQELLSVVSCDYPKARLSLDIAARDWKSWKSEVDLEVVCGGPMCNPFSTAGKKLGGGHEQADQIYLMEEAASDLSARWLQIENVPNLLHDFKDFFDEFVAYCSRRGWAFLGAECLVQSELGGATTRKRIWPIFEKKEVAMKLPPLCSGRVSRKCGSIRMKIVDLTGGRKPDGEFEQWAVPVVGSSGTIRVGTLWMGGPDCTVPSRGNVVKLVPDRDQRIFATHKGVKISLCSVKERFTVMEVMEGRVKLLFDNRDGPLWLWRPIARIEMICRSSSPVFSIDGPGPTIRSMRVPPGENGFLIWDDRSATSCVRALSGEQIWRLQGLDPDLAHRLLKAGFSWDKLGELAGSSIPEEMCKLQAEKLSERVIWLRSVERLEKAIGVPFLHSEAPSVLGTFAFKTVLCLVSVSGDCKLLVHESLSALPGLCEELKVSAESSVQAAERWASKLLGTNVLGFLAAEKSVSGLLSRIVVVPVGAQDKIDLPCLVWASIEQLSEAKSSLADVLLVATARIASFRNGPHDLGPLTVRAREVSLKRFHWNKSEESGWKEGKTPVMKIEPEVFGKAEEIKLASGEWKAAVGKLCDNQRELQAAIRCIEVDHPAYAWLQETADAMKPLDVTEFPIELLQLSMGKVTTEMALKMPFPEEFKPPNTDWLPRAEQCATPQARFKPKCLADLVSTEGLARLEAWTTKAVKDLGRMHKLGAAAGRQHNEVLVLSQEDLVPEARGVFWDLRKASEGIVVPLDFEAPLQTHLDLDYLKSLVERGPLKDYPDQQLISQLLLGVRYRGKLDMQIVLLPHLISFGHGCVEIQKEMLELEERGWYSFHDSLPFVPFRNIPRGSTGKQDGSWRPTSELRAPRKRIWDKSGKEVVPHNVAINLSHWEKERKPSMGHFMQALAVLLVLAVLAGEPIFFFSDDMQKMFNQLKLAPEELWSANSLLLGQNGGPIWASEQVMPFGVSCGSNIAQAWAHMLLFLVRSLMDEMEAAARVSNSVLNTLLQARSKLWKKQEQSRPYFAVMYTDDSATAIVGVQRTVRFLCAWFEVITKFNILMAPPRKRQLGCRLQWIGGIVLATGAVTVGLQKRVRAIQELKKLLAGKLVMSALRKLLGLLEHFVYILALKRNLVAAIYEPMKGSDGCENPEAKVEPSKAMCSTAARMIKVVASKAGSFVTAFTTELAPLNASSRVISWHSDAARERDFEGHFQSQFELDGDTVGIGLGGYAAGYWWNWPLSRESHELHISTLEALAFALNFFVFGPLFEEMVGPETALLTHCDAMASVLGVAFGRSKALMLIHVFDKLEHLAAFKKVKKFTATTHVAGPGNLMADAASRGKVQVIKDFTAQLGVTAIKKKLPKSAVAFINEAVAYARSLSLVEQSLGIEQPNTPDSASFPSGKIPRMVSDDGIVLGPGGISVLGSTQADQLARSTQRRGTIPRMVSSSGTVMECSALPLDDSSGRSSKKSVAVNCSVRAVRVVDHYAAPAEPTAPRPKKLSVLQQGRRDALEGLSRSVADSVSDALAEDPCFSKPGLKMNEMIQGMFGSVLHSVPEGTKVIDARDWGLWCGVMGDLGVAPWRGDMTAHRGLDTGGYWREVMLQAIAFYSCLREVKPRKKRLNPDGGVIPAKPESVTVVKSVRRIHKYFGIVMAESKIYGNVLRAATNKFIEENGLAALMPHRKEPFTNQQIQEMLAVPQGLKLGGREVCHNSRFWRSVELLIKVQAQTGFRLGDALKMNRDAVRFDFRGTVFPMAEEGMRLHVGSEHYAIITPQRTKSDPLGTHWSPYPVYLEAGSDDTVGAGRALYFYEFDFGVPLTKRHREPLFTDDQGVRLTRPTLERVLRDLLIHIGANPESHSWHSFRIYLAVALKQAGADDSRIKAMLRWVSDKSLRIYARDSKTEYTKWLRGAASANVDSIYVQSLPELDEDRVMAALNDLLSGDFEG